MSRKRKRSARRAKIAAVVFAVSLILFGVLSILHTLMGITAPTIIFIVLGVSALMSLFWAWFDGETAAGGLDYADQIRYEKRKKREALRKQTGGSHA